jgi:hypothetical protein
MKEWAFEGFWDLRDLRTALQAASQEYRLSTYFSAIGVQT